MARNFSKSTVREAYDKIVEDCVSQIVAYEAGVVNNTQAHHPESECLHKMRVGVRRLRSAQTLFRPALEAGSAKELQWMQQTLGRARDWDVLIEQTAEPLVAHFQDKQDMSAFVAAADSRRRAAYNEVVAMIGSDRYRMTIMRFIALRSPIDDRWADVPIKKFADMALRKRFRKLRHMGRNISKVGHGEVLHDIRKSAKKLRYGVDFFESLYPRKLVRRYQNALADLQTTIGGVTDLDAGEEMLHALKPKKHHQEASLDQARNLLLGWMMGQSYDHDQHVEQSWQQFAKLTDNKPLWSS